MAPYKVANVLYPVGKVRDLSFLRGDWDSLPRAVRKYHIGFWLEKEEERKSPGQTIYLWETIMPSW